MDLDRQNILATKRTHPANKKFARRIAGSRFDAIGGGAHHGAVNTRPPKRFDPVAAARAELEDARTEHGRAQAVTALLAERVSLLEAWIGEAERLGLTSESPEIPAVPLLGGNGGGLAARTASQWDWVRFALLQFTDAVEPKTILARIAAEGGPIISRTSLGALLRRREQSGEIEHVRRAWRLCRPFV